MFIIAKSGKSQRCPSTEEWINELWCIHTVKCYSADKIDQLEIHALKWIDTPRNIKWKKKVAEDYWLCKTKCKYDTSRLFMGIYIFSKSIKHEAEW